MQGIRVSCNEEKKELKKTAQGTQETRKTRKPIKTRGKRKLGGREDSLTKKHAGEKIYITFVRLSRKRKGKEQESPFEGQRGGTRRLRKVFDGARVFVQKQPVRRSTYSSHERTVGRGR